MSGRSHRNAGRGRGGCRPLRRPGLLYGQGTPGEASEPEDRKAFRVYPDRSGCCLSGRAGSQEEEGDRQESTATSQVRGDCDLIRPPHLFTGARREPARPPPAGAGSEEARTVQVEPHGAGGGEGGAPSLTAGSPAPRAGPGIKVCRIDDLQIMALKADLVPNQL